MGDGLLADVAAPIADLKRDGILLDEVEHPLARIDDQLNVRPRLTGAVAAAEKIDGALAAGIPCFQLRPLGRICEAQIKALELRYGICVQKYVIMPNHIHLLLTIDRAEQSPAPTVSDMVCAFKSLTARQANREENKPHRKIWQRSFYDHVIRNEQDYLEIWKYIDENPVKWELDQFYY